MVRAEMDGSSVAPDRAVNLGAKFQFSYQNFLEARIPAGAEQDQKLRQIGEAVGGVIFSGGIDGSLTGLLKDARENGEAIDLVVESEVPGFLAIPFEAARLADGRAPALEPGVRMVRRLVGSRSDSPDPQPGPLKILVAVGAPDEGKTRNSVLDMEREVQAILDAVKDARELGNAYVRILDVGSLDQVRSSLQEQAYHVLHLSGHGNAGRLEMEDEDGNPVPMTADELADAIRDSGHAAPLVFFASCLSGSGSSETVSLAQGLLMRGVPAVMAMQTSVTDRYSTQLSAAFYAQLSTGDRPRASAALAVARQGLERQRSEARARGEHIAAEYATASLSLSCPEAPVLDRSLNFARPVESSRKAASGVVPLLSIGDLIGRRAEVRRVMRVLTDDPRSVEEMGRKAGCQILGHRGCGEKLHCRPRDGAAERGRVELCRGRGQVDTERTGDEVGR